MRSGRLFPAVVAALLSTQPAAAQTKLPLVGLVSSGDAQIAQSATNRDAFLRGMTELGYVEGRNIAYDIRFWGTNTNRIPAIVAEFARKPVDIIVTQATAGALAVRAHAPAIRSVFLSAADPVGAGLVDSLGRPGGNMTGNAMLSPELAVKRLELLKELLPTGRQVAVLRRRGSDQHSRMYREIEAAAPSLGFHVQPFDAAGEEDAERVAREIMAWPAEGLLVLEDPNINITFFRTPWAPHSSVRTLRNTVPAVCAFRSTVENGCLISYGPSLPDLFYRAASYVDKILKGADPGELPVQQPVKFELAVNMKTAKTVGITIPQSVMYRATEVVE